MALFDMKSAQNVKRIKQEQEEFKKTNVRSVMKLKQMKDEKSQRKIQLQPEPVNPSVTKEDLE